jgi:hypothetical protein
MDDQETEAKHLIEVNYQVYSLKALVKFKMEDKAKVDREKRRVEV